MGHLANRLTGHAARDEAITRCLAEARWCVIEQRDREGARGGRIRKGREERIRKEEEEEMEVKEQEDVEEKSRERGQRMVRKRR